MYMLKLFVSTVPKKAPYIALLFLGSASVIIKTGLVT